MAQGFIKKEAIHDITIAYADTTSTNYADSIVAILTANAPQSKPVGAYLGLFRQTSASNPTLPIYNGFYILYVAYTNTNYATQGIVMAQGRLYKVWYQNGVWTATEVT